MAVDYFLKIDGIPGESQDHKHKDEIQLQSFSFGESQTGTMAFGGGGGAGKVQMQDFHFTMSTNKATAALFLACANGSHIKSAVLNARKAGKGQHDYLTVKFSDVLVSSFTTSGVSGGDGLPTDSCSLNFSKIEWDYKLQKEDGSVVPGAKGEYDLKKNQ